jgi:hypothetical protein
VFERFDGNERLLVAVNAGATTASATVAGDLGLIWGPGTHTGAKVTVPARSGAVWQVR